MTLRLKIGVLALMVAGVLLNEKGSEVGVWTWGGFALGVLGWLLLWLAVYLTFEAGRRAPR